MSTINKMNTYILLLMFKKRTLPISTFESSWVHFINHILSSPHRDHYCLKCVFIISFTFLIFLPYIYVFLIYDLIICFTYYHYITIILWIAFLKVNIFLKFIYIDALEIVHLFSFLYSILAYEYCMAGPLFYK